MKPWLLTRSFSNQVFVYPIGVPFLFATILFVNRRAIKNETRGGDNWLVRDSNPTLERLAVLYDVYKPEKWWWEVSPKPKRSCAMERIQTYPITVQVYESLRRVMTTGVLVLIDPGAILKIP